METHLQLTLYHHLILLLRPMVTLVISNHLFDGTIDVTGTGTISGWDISSNRFHGDSTDEIRLDSNVRKK